jgi:hypothetical protein
MKDEVSLYNRWKTYLWILIVASLFNVYIIFEFITKIGVPRNPVYTILVILPVFLLALAWATWLLTFNRIAESRRMLMRNKEEAKSVSDESALDYELYISKRYQLLDNIIVMYFVILLLSTVLLIVIALSQIKPIEQ